MTIRHGAIYRRVIALARNAERDPASVGLLSTGERCAVALLCDRHEFLPDGYTFLHAVDRIKGAWLDACIRAICDGWRE